MSRTTLDELSVWNFPDLKELSHEDVNSLIVNNVSIPKEEKFKIKEAEQENNENEQSSVKQDNELENIKNEYNKKIELVNNLLVSLEKPLTLLDGELIELIQYIIAKSVKNIIYKEIKTDSKLMNKIVKELSSLIDSKNGVVTIYLSEVDFNRLTEHDNSPSTIFKVNNSLSEGDIIIKSNFSEIRAVLNERINHLLGIKYA